MRRATLILATLIFVLLILSLPSSLKYARENRNLYLFSEAFIQDIPKRLGGPGRLRFIFQPLISIVLGIRSGIKDAKDGRPPFLWGVLFRRHMRGELLKSSFTTLLNMLLMGVVLDSICQWLIIGNSYFGAALVIGPMLIIAPYTLSRSLVTGAFPRGRHP